MPTAKYPRMTASELEKLYEEHKTWTEVAQYLEISRSGFYSLIHRLDVNVSINRKQWRKKPSLLDDYFHDIQALARQGNTCREIRDTLDLPVQPEQVRRWLHKNDIELHAKQGAQPAEKHRDWKGGRIITKDGYVLIYQPDHPNARANGYILEHRQVMADHIGVSLTSVKRKLTRLMGDKFRMFQDNVCLFETLYPMKTLQS